LFLNCDVILTIYPLASFHLTSPEEPFANTTRLRWTALFLPHDVHATTWLHVFGTDNKQWSKSDHNLRQGPRVAACRYSRRWDWWMRIR